LLRNLEETNAKKTAEQREKDRNRIPPEPGSTNDFMAQQALHELMGQPVVLSKAMVVTEDPMDKVDQPASAAKAGSAAAASTPAASAAVAASAAEKK